MKGRLSLSTASNNAFLSSQQPRSCLFQTLVCLACDRIGKKAGGKKDAGSSQGGAHLDTPFIIVLEQGRRQEARRTLTAKGGQLKGLLLMEERVMLVLAHQVCFNLNFVRICTSFIVAAAHKCTKYSHTHTHCNCTQALPWEQPLCLAV